MSKKLLFFSLALIICFSLSPLALNAQEAKPEKIMIAESDNWKAQLYGFVKLDAVYNTSSVFNAESPLWANSHTNLRYVPNGTEKDGSFIMSARTSRLGFIINGPKVFLGGETMARFEFDFWGGLPDAGASIRTSEMRIRLAYVKVTWPSQTYILAGNDWMLGTPLYVLPDMFAFLPLTGAGLLFMREPQVAIGQTVGPKAFNVTLDASVALAQGNDGKGATSDFFNPGPRGSSSDNQTYQTGVGEASKQPSYKARLTIRVNPLDKINIILGGTGQYMQEKHALRLVGREGSVNIAQLSTAQLAYVTNNPYAYTQKMVDSWFLQGFASFKVFFVKLSGHFFTGENIDTYFGGIGQGVTKRFEGWLYDSVNNPYNLPITPHIDPVSSMGGWAELLFDFREFNVPFTISAGAGMEKARKSTLPSEYVFVPQSATGYAPANLFAYLSPGSTTLITDYRTMNMVKWVNFWWYWSTQYRWGVEAEYYQTKYLAKQSGNNWKIHSAFQFVF